jgi:hypothetical protein
MTSLVVKIRVKTLIACLYLILQICNCTDQCWEKFDPNLRNQCSRGKNRDVILYENYLRRMATTLLL